MLRIRTLLAVLIVATVCPHKASASTLVVPDDAPTIQAAINGSSDTVLVRSGDYPEQVVAPRVIKLLAHPGNTAGDSVHIQGLSVQTVNDGEAIVLRGLHIRSQVSMFTNGRYPLVEFDSCRLEGGLAHDSEHNGVGLFKIVGCVLNANVDLHSPESAEIRHNVLANAGVGLFSGGPVVFSDNVAIGPGGAAISGDDYALRAERNVISGYNRGISWGGDRESFIADNRVDHCGYGIVSGYVITRNHVTDCDIGIVARNDQNDVHDNVVLRSLTVGISAGDGSNRIHSNVVGDGMGVGFLIHSTQDIVHLEMSNNTSYLNGGHGYDVSFPPAFGDSVNFTRNIAYGNGGYGLAIGAGTSIRLACNDWFHNTNGATLGTGIGSSDLQVDPEFCNVDHDSVTLSQGSPLIDSPGCGLIGALGKGCSSVTATLLTTMMATPMGKGIEVRWQFAGHSDVTEIRLERASGISGPWNTIMHVTGPEAASEVYIDRDVAAGRTYFYRLVWSTHSGETAISEVLEAYAIRTVSGLALAPVTPNPAGAVARFAFTLPARGPVDLDVIDVQGRTVARVIRGIHEAGSYTREWRSGAAAGTYFARLRFGGRSIVRRFAVTR